ncbi:S8/S53 family peptidase [Microbispora sp. GKU 823]|uniref:S8/S53 family peptidase n=1 Tax=Microbispora sp. GKU 823 TaxID=1652100 RepID=UPI0009D416B7|nr:S8/S53 family peptidase [Microbispora sp. GKU 823]OPG13115.1 hypothetical protein B1L11_09980 [Microbispora sp. GKU 823]
MLKRTLPLLVAAMLLPAAPASASTDDVLGQLAGDLQAAHRLATGKGVTIAILSDGVDPGLHELAGRLKIAPDLVKRTEPDQRVGTLLASAIAGTGTITDRPIKGIAPAATILSVRVRPSSTAAYKKFLQTDALDKVATGLRYATDHGAKVVFIEEGRGAAANTDKLAQAVDYALRKNVVIVAEASRLVTYEGKPIPPESLSYPVALPGVIGVGATDEKGRPLTKMSARNSTVLLSAPGTRLNVTGDGNQSRWYIYGPPTAAAWVVGTAALIKEKYPKLSPARVAQALAVSVRHRPRGGYDATVGNGILNPVEALRQAARLNQLPGSAPPSKYAVRPTTRFGGLPDSPIKAVQWDGTKLIRYGSISGAGFLLLVISLAIAAVAVIRRRRERLESTVPGGPLTDRSLGTPPAVAEPGGMNHRPE